MPKISAQAAYDMACEEYNKGKKMVRELSSLVQKVSPKFSYDIAVREYDFILQGILLNVAMADGLFVANEKIFIRDITDHGDILIRLNSEIKNKGGDLPEIEWDDLEDLSDETRKFIAASALLMLNDAVDDFIEPFAIIDANTSRNYLEDLRHNICMIVGYLTVVDGDDLDSNDADLEMLTGMKAFDLYVGNKWTKVKNEN